MILTGAFVINFWPSVKVHVSDTRLNETPAEHELRMEMDRISDRYKTGSLPWRVLWKEKWEEYSKLIEERGYNELEGRINFVQKHIVTEDKVIPYKLEDGEVQVVNPEDKDQEVLVSLAYQDGKSTQEVIFKRKLPDFLRSLLVVLPYSIGILYVFNARKIAEFYMSLYAKNVEPSDFMVFRLGCGGVMIIGLGIYFTIVALIVLSR